MAGRTTVKQIHCEPSGIDQFNDYLKNLVKSFFSTVNFPIPMFVCSIELCTNLAHS